MSKWKTVDNPPEDQSNVLVIGYNLYAMGWYYDNDKKWMIYNFEGTEETRQVTHWRKLPKLPKE